jgi:hypothetical protein
MYDALLNYARKVLVVAVFTECEMMMEEEKKEVEVRKEKTKHKRKTAVIRWTKEAEGTRKRRRCKGE